MKTPTLIGGWCALGCAALFAGERPNVLFIAVDDLKPMLGCYGAPLIRTPSIDRLAGRGVRFDRAYTNQAVCAPSRNALMTGLRPDTIGVYDLMTFFRKARPDAVTLPQYFKARGYRSESLGKLYHLGHGNSDDPVRSWSSKPWTPKGGHRAVPAESGRGPAVESADVPDQQYADGMIADEAIRRFDAAKADRISDQAKQAPGQLLLPIGRHRITLRIDRQRFGRDSIRAEFAPVEFGQAILSVIGGK